MRALDDAVETDARGPGEPAAPEDRQMGAGAEKFDGIACPRCATAKWARGPVRHGRSHADEGLVCQVDAYSKVGSNVGRETATQLKSR